MLVTPSRSVREYAARTPMVGRPLRMLSPYRPLKVSWLRPYRVVARANEVPTAARLESESNEPASPADKETRPRVSVKIFSGSSTVEDVPCPFGRLRVIARVAVDDRRTHFQSSLIAEVGFVYSSSTVLKIVAIRI